MTRYDAFLKWKNRVNETVNVLANENLTPSIFEMLDEDEREQKFYNIFYDGSRDSRICRLTLFKRLPLNDEITKEMREIFEKKKAVLENNPEYFDYLIYKTEKARNLMKELYYLLKHAPLDYNISVFHVDKFKQYYENAVSIDLFLSVFDGRNYHQMRTLVVCQVETAMENLAQVMDTGIARDFEHCVKAIDRYLENRIKVLERYKKSVCKNIDKTSHPVLRKDAAAESLRKIVLMKKQLSNAMDRKYETTFINIHDVLKDTIETLAKAIQHKSTVYITNRIRLNFDLMRMSFENEIHRKSVAKSVLKLKDILKTFYEFEKATDFEISKGIQIYRVKSFQEYISVEYVFYNTNYVLELKNFERMFERIPEIDVKNLTNSRMLYDKELLFKILENIAYEINNIGISNAGNTDSDKSDAGNRPRTRKLAVV